MQSQVVVVVVFFFVFVFFFGGKGSLGLGKCTEDKNSTFTVLYVLDNYIKLH